jgi:hypothetical protein
MPALNEQASRTTRARKPSQRFADWEREDQLEAFFAWLPQELHDAPGIDWTSLPPQAMGYCVRTVGKNPDAVYLALTAATALDSVDKPTLVKMLGFLKGLFKELRAVCQMEHVSDLKNAQIWDHFASNTAMTMKRRAQLKTYSALSSGHFPRYFQRLDSQARLRMQVYRLPPLSPGFLRTYAGDTPLQTKSQKKRKASSDVLVPLYPVLRQLVRFRKQVAERTFKAIQEARLLVEVGDTTLPFHFQHMDVLPCVNREARTISEVEMQGREVTMDFTLWDKRTWVAHYPDRFKGRKDAARKNDEDWQGKNSFFVQYHGEPSNFLWIGDLIEHRLFQNFTRNDEHRVEFHQRKQLARSLGFSNGCLCSRPGILNTGDRWFTDNERAGDFLFEPESLYRGILMGATLATIALSNGSRVSELLQVSLDRRITHTENVTVLGSDGHAMPGHDGQPMIKQVKMHLQHLLPKGSKTEEERQLFPLSREAIRLLGEIKKDLERSYGEIPVVFPSRTSVKYEHLKPERYFFQWAATPDGKYGIIGVQDVQILLRFMLHGLELSTSTGEPIRVSTHLLRHVMATDARQYRHVPPEAIAHFFLHHRLKTHLDPSVSVVSDYYWQMTHEQQLALIREYLDEQEEHDRTLVLAQPTQRDLELMNEDLRLVYEQWQTLHPTAFGYCGCSGLCPRGKDRALCIGCSYLVEDPERIGAVLAWRSSFAKQAEMLEAQGNVIDARQARIKVQQLDDHVNVMRLQLQAEADGHYIPLQRVLPSPFRQTEESNEEEI